MPTPKAILFDIGGVCVVSPMSAIVDYEAQNGLPKDYINFAISRTAPDGAWHRLERGDIKMDDEFFTQFHADLNRQDLWELYHAGWGATRGPKPTLAELAKSNATQLGDPVSLKAETSGTNPTPEEGGAGPSASLATNARSSGKRSLAQSYQKNMLGDPTSLVNEGSNSQPVERADQATGYEKGGASDGAVGVGGSAGGSGEPESSLKQSYKKNMLGDPTSLKNEGSASDPMPDQADTGYSKDGSEPSGPKSTASSTSTGSGSSSSGSEKGSLAQSYKKNMLGDPTSLKNETSGSDPLPDQSDTGYSKSSSSASSSSSIPALPKIDSTTLFWDMMARSRNPDPHMFPALQNLRKSGKFVIGALSNTVTFPPDHPYSQVAADDPNDVRNQFDIFVSSADIGLRKPDPAIYKVAVEMMDKYSREKGGSGVRAEEVCFLDDIGQNLKPARKVGMQTIKVNMGRVDEAVRELEKVTGLKLAGDKAKL